MYMQLLFIKRGFLTAQGPQVGLGSYPVVLEA